LATTAVVTASGFGKLAFGLGVSPARLVEPDEKTPPSKVSGHIAKIISKLEDEDERVQRGAAEVVVAYLRALRTAVGTKR